MTAEDQRRLHNLATIGTVSAIDTDNILMRLTVGDNETDWLSIPTVSAGQVRVWRCPSIGEQFLLVCPSGELANAIPVQSLYSEANPSPSHDADEIRIRFNDKDFLSIDVADSLYTLHLSDMTFDADTGIKMDTPQVIITGDLQVDGKVHCDTTITADDEVTADGINLTSHRHSGVTSGPSTTGQPV